jgi:mersacidin/lichenicidin family type 2 lantibiotic
MDKNDLIRAWKDPLYRSTLGPEELSALPAHPAGIIELRDEDLRGIGGAIITTARGCTVLTFLNWQACGCPVTTG